MNSSHESSGDFELSEIEIQKGSILIGRTIRQYGQIENSISFVAIVRLSSETKMKPHGNESFQPGDVVIVAGYAQDLARMKELAQGPCDTAFATAFSDDGLADSPCSDKDLVREAPVSTNV